MDDVLKLPETMDVARARAVANDLSQHRGEDLKMDASDVTKMSALAVEVLLSGAKQWQADGKTFAIAPSSEAFLTTLNDLGVRPEHVGAISDAPKGAADDFTASIVGESSGGKTDDTERGQT